jgi:hypothetical protein
VRSDELHTTFNFDALMCEWTAASSATSSTDAGLDECGRGATHLGARQPRHDSRRDPLRASITGMRFNSDGLDAESFAGIGMVPQATPMSPSVGNGPEPPCCSNWLCREARTSIRVTS